MTTKPKIPPADRQAARDLIRAAGLVEKHGLAIGVMAVDSSGSPCCSTDKEAVSWCSLGAIEKATLPDFDRDRCADDAFRDFLRAVDGFKDGDIGYWNDHNHKPGRVGGRAVGKKMRACAQWLMSGRKVKP